MPNRSYIPFKPRGFTLIELLVAIAIVAVLSSVGLVVYSKAQSAARDTKRKQDLRSIATALEIYYQANGRYPCTANAAFEYSTSPSSFWIDDDVNSANPTICDGNKPLNNNYINQMPSDPKTNSGADPRTANTWGYAYYSGGSSSPCATIGGRQYFLVTRLENTGDPDSVGVRGGKWCDGTTDLTAVAGEPFAADNFVITSW